jgi:hypothetical protein
MPTCPKCNAEVADGAPSCPSCGAPLATESPQIWPPSTGIGVAPPPGKPTMDPVEVKKSNILIIVAILGQIAGYALKMNGIAGNAGQIVVYISLIPWFWGLGCYAKAKGYSYWTGALGVLSCLGLAILIFMPIKRVTPQ